MEINIPLLELESKIIKSIPRLMEVTPGCILHSSNGTRYRILDIDSSSYKVLDEDTNDVILLSKLFSQYTVYGHDVKLNDVMEWLLQFEVLIMLDPWGDFRTEDMDYVFHSRWNLNSMYLRDQSSKLINDLNSL